MGKNELIRAVYKKPGHEPEWMFLDNDLENYQDLLGGYIEVVPWDDRYLMIVNEEGKLQGLPRNFTFYGDNIAGPALWVAQTGADFTGILDDHFIDEVRFFTCGGNLEDDPDDVGVSLDLEDFFNELIERGGKR